METDARHPSPASARVESIDAIRGVALFGVLIVHVVTVFSVSIFQQFIGPAPTHLASDPALERLVLLGIESKALCIFGLLFGVGLAIQFERLSGTGRPLYWLARRLGVLLILGLVHLLLLFNGDILVEYAIAGFVVLPLLLLPAAGLLVATVVFLLVYAVQAALYPVPWATADELRQHVAVATDIYSSGGFAEIRRFSLSELRLMAPLLVFVFPRTLAFFAFGMFLWRSGYLRQPRKFVDETAAVALIALAAGAGLTVKGHTLAPVVLALGYGAALWLLAGWPPTRRLVAWFAPIGRMAFTNYLLQSVVLGFVFFGYGLGQFGRVGATAAFALGLALYVAQLLASRWWLRRYRFGPVEWLWRRLMYGTRQPFRAA